MGILEITTVRTVDVIDNKVFKAHLSDSRELVFELEKRCANHQRRAVCDQLAAAVFGASKWYHVENIMRAFGNPGKVIS